MAPRLERLYELFVYDTAAGRLRMKVSLGKRRKGQLAGHLTAKGYWTVSVDNRRYMEHVVVWAMMTGKWPVLLIDHRNTVRGDNRFGNLRLADKSKNAQNSKCRADSLTGVKGVSLGPHGAKYRARVAVNGRRVEVAGFPTIELAKEFRDLLADLMHGEFVRY